MNLDAPQRELSGSEEGRWASACAGSSTVSFGAAFFPSCRDRLSQNISAAVHTGPHDTSRLGWTRAQRRICISFLCTWVKPCAHPLTPLLGYSPFNIPPGANDIAASITQWSGLRPFTGTPHGRVTGSERWTWGWIGGAQRDGEDWSIEFRAWSEVRHERGAQVLELLRNPWVSNEVKQTLSIVVWESGPDYSWLFRLDLLRSRWTMKDIHAWSRV